MQIEKLCKLENGTLLLSTDAVCKAFDITRQALNKWEKEGCPKAKRGWWNIALIVNWKVDKEVGKMRKDDEMTDKDRKTFYEANLKAAQSEAAEIKNAIVRGEYLEKTSVEAELRRFLLVFKRAALSIPRLMAVEVAPFVEHEQARAIESMISTSIEKILENFSLGNLDDS